MPHIANFLEFFSALSHDEAVCISTIDKLHHYLCLVLLFRFLYEMSVILTHYHSIGSCYFVCLFVFVFLEINLYMLIQCGSLATDHAMGLSILGGQ